MKTVADQFAETLVVAGVSGSTASLATARRSNLSHAEPILNRRSNGAPIDPLGLPSIGVRHEQAGHTYT